MRITSTPGAKGTRPFNLTYQAFGSLSWLRQTVLRISTELQHGFYLQGGQIVLPQSKYAHDLLPCLAPDSSSSSDCRTSQFKLSIMSHPDTTAGSGSSSTNVAPAPLRKTSAQSLASPDAQQPSPSPSQSAVAPPQQQQQQQHAPPPPPPFQPIFTLITDSTSRATHHPSVHYIFSDDDPDLLTSALTQQRSTSHGHDPSSLGSGSKAGRADRAIVLDLVPSGVGPETSTGGVSYDVAWASSLSADWAVTSARVSRLEEGEGESDDPSSGRLMLRIEGVGVTSIPPVPGGKSPSPLPAGEAAELQGSGGSGGNSGRQQASAVEQEDYGALIEEFEKRMSVLKKVVDAGEERRRKTIGEEAEEEGQQDDAPQDKAGAQD